MAGRGRGRGGKYTFNLESLGIGKGENLPSSSVTPPPLYPPLPVKPASFTSTQGDQYSYLLEQKQELSNTFKSSRFHLLPPKIDLEIERYSDKFATQPIQNQNVNDLVDWRIMPSELRPRAKKRIQIKKPEDDKKKIEKILTKLEEAEETEEKEAVSEEEKSEAGSAILESGEENFEDDAEEDNDYAKDYFDNGEKFLDDSDDDEEGPTYH